MKGGKTRLPLLYGAMEHVSWDDVDTEFLLGLPYLEVPVVLGQPATHTCRGSEYVEYAVVIKAMPEDQSRIWEVADKMTRFHLSEAAKKGKIVLRIPPDIYDYHDAKELHGKQIRLYLSYAVEP